MQTYSIPPIGTVWPGQGGIFVGIGRGQNGQGDYALILPTDAAATFAPGPWGERGLDVPSATSQHDGLANTQAMATAGSQLAQQILALRIEGHADFYLPAKADADLLRANVPELFEKDWYWTSTQHSRYGAWIQGFEYGLSGHDGKGDRCRAVALRRLPLQPFTA